ncbi:MAG: ABC transporter permease [Marinilabiliales bacterium]|nr:MAG: ABC transporter permease [Marinilabiliales bacterium]
MMMFAVAIGLWGGLLALGIANGLVTERQRTTIEQHVSHIQIHNPEYLKDDNIRNHIGNYKELMDTISSIPRVKGYSGRTMVTGMLATANLTTGVRIIGIAPPLENQTSSIGSNIIEGSYFEDPGRNPVLVGRTLADKIKVQERSRVVLTFQDPDNEIISAAFRVSGIFQTSNTTFDETNVYILQSDLVSYLDSVTMVSEIAIILDDIDESEPVAAFLKEQFPELEVRTWAEVSPELSYLNEMFGVMITIILGIILLAMAFGLVNTMLMSVYERIQELGMLMAVGMNKKKIFSMILLETSFITFGGAAGGVLLGYITIRAIQNTGLNLAVVGGDSLEYMGFPSVIYPALDPSFYYTLTIMVVITVFLAAILPALRALRLKPAEAVRHE